MYRSYKTSWTLFAPLDFVDFFVLVKVSSFPELFMCNELLGIELWIQLYKSVRCWGTMDGLVSGAFITIGMVGSPETDGHPLNERKRFGWAGRENGWSSHM